VYCCSIWCLHIPYVFTIFFYTLLTMNMMLLMWGWIHIYVYSNILVCSWFLSFHLAITFVLIVPQHRHILCAVCTEKNVYYNIHISWMDGIIYFYAADMTILMLFPALIVIWQFTYDIVVVWIIGFESRINIFFSRL